MNKELTESDIDTIYDTWDLLTKPDQIKLIEELIHMGYSKSSLETKLQKKVYPPCEVINVNFVTKQVITRELWL